MPWNPIADHSSELAGLQSKTAVSQWRFFYVAADVRLVVELILIVELVRLPLFSADFAMKLAN